MFGALGALLAGGVGYYLGLMRPLPRALREARRRLEEASRQLSIREREFSTLEDVTDVIKAHPGTPGILAAIVSMVAKSLEADVCAFLLLDEAAGELVTQGGAYGIADGEESHYRLSLKNTASSSVRVFLGGEPYLSADAQSDPGVISSLARLWKVRSLIVVPLISQGRRIGVLRVGSHRKGFFNTGHLRLLNLIAEEAAVLVDSAVLSQKLADMSLQMARVNKLKDDFVSTVSHEFKTPLTSIKGFLSILLDTEAGPLNENQRRFLEIIRGASERLNALVSDLLDIAKLEDGVRFEAAPVSLEAVARRCVEAHSYVAQQRKIALSLREGGGLPPAIGDAGWLGQVFDNLISNSLKFTLPGGEVLVSVDLAGGRLRCMVSDTGVGIPLEDQQRIFDKFYRADNRDETNAPGTGLGLAICKSVVERHGGRIWVESSPGSGSRFFFDLPAAPEAVGAGESRAEG